MRRVSFAAGAAAMVVALIAVIWLVRVSTASPGRAADRAWRVLPGAFPVDDDWMSGPRLLVPSPSGCFVGLGTDSNYAGTGKIPAYWQAAGDCTKPQRIGGKDRPVGDGLPSEDRSTVMAAVPAHGGGYLAVGRHIYHGDAYAYDSQVYRGEPGSWRRIAEFRTGTPTSSHIGPAALVTIKGGYLAVGHRERTAVAWTSADGIRWREVLLPGAGEATVKTVTAGPDGRLVAVGDRGYARPAGWVSTDGGAHWQAANMPKTGGTPQLWTVVHDGQQYMALGGVDGEQRAAALVLISYDGLTWHRDDTAANAGARLMTAAVALPDGTVYAAAGTGPNAQMPNEQCAVVWRWDGQRWVAEDLGCHGIPTSFAPLGDGGVAAVHWSTLFLRSTPAG